MTLTAGRAQDFAAIAALFSGLLTAYLAVGDLFSLLLLLELQGVLLLGLLGASLEMGRRASAGGRDFA